MGGATSLAHTKWHCKCHIVFVPKYRRQGFYGEKKSALGELLRKLCEFSIPLQRLRLQPHEQSFRQVFNHKHDDAPVPGAVEGVASFSDGIGDVACYGFR